MAAMDASSSSASEEATIVGRQSILARIYQLAITFSQVSE